MSSQRSFSPAVPTLVLLAATLAACVGQGIAPARSAVLESARFT